jgi:hypothetical protein
MLSTIRLDCDDSRVRSSLRTWLDAGRLKPPVPLTIEVRVVDAIPPADDGAAVFEQPTVEIRTGSGQDIHISWTRAPAAAVLAPDARAARVLLTPAAVARLDECTQSFMVTVLIFLLRRAGWHHVHAATAIDPSGRGWLIAGNGHAGKSTTAALLASRRWPVGTDDIAFLAQAGERVAVHAYRAPIALRQGGYELLNRGGGVFLERRRKVAYWPEELGSQWAPCVEPDVLLFPSIGNGRTEVQPLGAGETLAELVRWSAWVLLEPELAQPHLDLLARLARQARRFRVTLGHDLFTHPERLEELVS